MNENSQKSKNVKDLNKKLSGKVLFLDRDNINTDEIIPAKYLTEIDKEPLKKHLLEDLKLEGFVPSKINWSEYAAIITRKNFGCGSSREMAPWAFQVNGIDIIIAQSFARIFKENAFNCGMLAIEFEKEDSEQIINSIFTEFASEPEVFINVDINNLIIKLFTSSKERLIKFNLNKFERELVLYGGWIELASKKY